MLEIHNKYIASGAIAINKGGDVALMNVVNSGDQLLAQLKSDEGFRIEVDFGNVTDPLSLAVFNKEFKPHYDELVRCLKSALFNGNVGLYNVVFVVEGETLKAQICISSFSKAVFTSFQLDFLQLFVSTFVSATKGIKAPSVMTPDLFKATFRSVLAPKDLKTLAKEIWKHMTDGTLDFSFKSKVTKNRSIIRNIKVSKWIFVDKLDLDVNALKMSVNVC